MSSIEQNTQANSHQVESCRAKLPGIQQDLLRDYRQRERQKHSDRFILSVIPILHDNRVLWKHTSET